MPLDLREAPRASRNVNVVGALRRGVTIEQAQAEADAIAARLERVYPESNRGFGVRVMKFRDSQIGADERGLSMAMMGAVVFVLLIGCANLANLLLVRGAARQREMAVRAAMGASRVQLVSSVLAETLVIAAIGGTVGVLASQWSLDFLRSSFPEELPYWLHFDPDIRVVLFAAGAALFTALATGFLPAIRAARASVVTDLKDTTRGTSLGRGALRLQGLLAAGQVALCLALLVGANLMIRSFLALQGADLGFDHRPILSARAYLAGDRYDDLPARAAFFARAAEALRALPGVTAAAATTSIPGDDGGAGVRLVADGQTSIDQDLAASSIAVTQGIFDVLDIRFIEGRPFTSTEAADPDADVRIVNARLAARLWPGKSAVDKRIGVRSGQDVMWVRVIGVVPDVHYEEIGEETASSQLNLYTPYAVSGARTMAFLVGSASTPELLAEPVRDALQRLNAGLPLFEVMPMAERRRYTTWEPRFFGQLMGTFAAIALLLACLGIYALLSYAARRRTQEIGVRLALGASPGAVVMMFVRQGARIAAAGLVAGLALAAGVAQALSGALWGVQPFDLASIFGIAAALLAVVLLASFWPARRAARVDPMSALRVE